MQSFFKMPRTVRPATVKTETASESSSHNSSTSVDSRWSRKQEKEQLSGLNDRLAVYIERVRNLESENAHLHVQIDQAEEVERREREVTVSRYESKVDELRRELEQIRHEKTKLEIEHNKQSNMYNEYKSENNKLTKKLQEAEKHVEKLNADLERCKASLNDAQAAKTKLEKDQTSMRAELSDYEYKHRTLQEKLDNEMLLRSDLQNKLKAQENDLACLKKYHADELKEIRQKRHVEISSFTTEVENHYKDKLQDHLKEMRADFETRFAQNRAEIDELYQNKLNEAMENATQHRNLSIEAREEVARQKMKVKEVEELLHSQNDKLQILTARTKELEYLLKYEKDLSDVRIKQRDERIQELENEIAHMMNEYRDLMDIKIQLDTELMAYHKLLEGEENRLRINASHESDTSNSSFPGVIQPTIRRAIKRRRLGHFSLGGIFQTVKKFACTGDSTDVIAIQEIDADGKFIKITNGSDLMKSIGGWTLVCTGGEREVTFKFRQAQIIEAHEAITVWSNNAEMEQLDGVKNIQMKNQIWPAADAMRAELFNANKESIAWKNCVAQSEEFIQ